MIHYELRCDSGHGFDGWFKDSASFERQAETGLLSCPACGTTSVGRALMAPAVTTRRKEVAPVAVAKEPAAGQTVAVDPARLPDHVRAALQKMRADIERHCEYVGDTFADEARRIHLGESDARGIYGETTPEQAEMLADEGIQVARIPWIPRADG